MALVSFTLSLTENIMLRNHLPFNYRNEVPKAEKRKEIKLEPNLFKIFNV